MGTGLADILKYAPIRTRLAEKAGDPDMRALHALANQAAFRDKTLLRHAAYAIEALAWPLACWIMAGRSDEKLDRAAEATGLSKAAYRTRMWRACTALKIPPNEYLHFAFHDPQRLARAGDFLFDIENYRLVGWLNEGLDIAPLQDKAAFAAVCEAHGLPTPPILALFSNGRPQLRADPSSPAWRRDLFLKPRGAKAGAGMNRIAYRDGAWINARGQSGDLADVLAAAANASHGVDLLIQPAIVNDAQTARFTNGALSTVRIMTGRFLDGRTVPIGAFFRLARGAAVVDNISAGGLMTTVDLATGRIGAANRRWDPYRLISEHPDTGVAFAGQVLSQWETMRDAALKAHGAFPDFAFVSWDIAATPQGPMIIEGNHHGGTVAFQELNGRPLSETPFAKVALEHLRRKRAAA